MQEIPYEPLDPRVQLLLDAFPEFLAEYFSDVYEPDDPQPYYTYYVLVNAKLSEWLSTDAHDEELARMFAFLERLAVSDAEDAQNFLTVAVLENLPTDLPQRNKALKHMGPVVREMYGFMALSVDESSNVGADASSIRQAITTALEVAVQFHNDPGFQNGARAWLEGRGVDAFHAGLYPMNVRHPLNTIDLGRLIAFYSQKAAERFEYSLEDARAYASSAMFYAAKL